MIIDENEYLEHYGTKMHSGRYPWGSGEDEIGGEHTAFVKYVNDLRKQGLKDPEVARALGIGSIDHRTGEFKPSTGQLRAQMTIAKAEQKHAQIAEAQKLHDKGLSNGAVAEKMGLAGESSVRALLAEGAADRANALMNTANMLKRQVDEKTFVDIGKGTEHTVGDVGIAPTRLTAAVAVLKEQGYRTHVVPIEQLGTGFETRTKVLCPPGTEWGDVMKNRDKIRLISERSEDGGRSFIKAHAPLAISPKRVGVKYKEDGGDEADGVIYVRPGVKDLSIGNNRYGQVRIQVGKNHYLKGMAIYKDDMPPGVDLLFNTNKSRKDAPNKLDAMKKLTDDPELPFGSIVRQIVSNPGTSKERVTSVMNMVGNKEGSGEAGAWGIWSKSLSSQFLSKQSPALAKTQLALTHEKRKNELDEILSLTNPVVKRKLLEKFAESTDSAAVHLKAAHMPRQATRVLLPVNSLKPTEVYAPGFRNGERVVLVRYPHGGKFEIPELTVNNKNRDAKKLIGDEPDTDAIGINHKVAKRLSGADFDGDTVIVIPNNSNRVKVAPSLEKLKNFEPRDSYGPYDGMRTIDGGVYNAKTKSVEFHGKRPTSSMQTEMGKVSNLITDMTLRQASNDDLARAVKHSMVVIDAEKHHLDYRRSAVENGISALKAQYQGGPTKGASTLISIKKQTKQVPQRALRRQSEGGPVDKSTGRLVYVETGRTRLDRNGNKVPVMEWVKKLDLTTDAHTLSSGTPMEKLYAEHSNKLRELSNKARLEAIKTPPLKRSASAAKTHSKEVESLTSKLALAERNAPLERQAQIIAKAAVKARKDLNPNLERDTIQKLEWQELDKARLRTGAKRQEIKITQEEWNAIQEGAISNSQLTRILDKADMDVVRQLAAPRVAKVMTNTKRARAMEMLADGYSRTDVADALGVSVSTLDLSVKG